MSSSESSFAQALERLPHGEAFRFVDEVTHLEPGVRGTGRYAVTGEEPFLAGHFPGRPMMPAVIMVEALAQLGGVVAQSGPEGALSDVRLTAMRNVKVFDAAVPGDALELRVRIVGRLGNLIQIEGQIEVGERTLMSAQLTLSGQKPATGDGDADFG